MHFNRFIHEALSSPWFLAPDQAVHYHAQLVQLLGSDKAVAETSDGIREKSQPTLAILGTSGAYKVLGNSSDFSGAQQGSIAVIPVDGPMMKNDNCGNAGTGTLAQWVNDAAANPNIIGIILSFDSPGGSVAGTETFSAAISAAKNIKPVLSFANDGMICSAAYWAASHSTEIMAGSKTSVIGSIGVYTSLVDYKAMYEKFGIKVEDIYSSLSANKNSDYRAWLEGNNQPTVDRLDKIASQFHNAVKSQRGSKITSKSSDPYAGGTYLAQDAVDNGLIDSIGSFNDAMIRITQLAQIKSQNSNTSAMKKISISTAFTSLMAFFNATPSAGQKDIEIEASQLEGLNTHLTSLNTKVSEQASEIATLTSSVATLTTERDELKATVAAYGVKPGATATNAIQEKTDGVEGAIENKVFEFAHEKEADALFGK